MTKLHENAELFDAVLNLSVICLMGAVGGFIIVFVTAFASTPKNAKRSSRLHYASRASIAFALFVVALVCVSTAMAFSLFIADTSYRSDFVLICLSVSVTASLLFSAIKPHERLSVDKLG